MVYGPQFWAKAIQLTPRFTEYISTRRVLVCLLGSRWRMDLSWMYTYIYIYTDILHVRIHHKILSCVVYIYIHIYNIYICIFTIYIYGYYKHVCLVRDTEYCFWRCDVIWHESTYNDPFAAGFVKPWFCPGVLQVKMTLIRVMVGTWSSTLRRGLCEAEKSLEEPNA